MDNMLHGVNLSGWLLPESWVTPELFASTGSIDDAELFQKLGKEAYDKQVGQHRASFITEQDFVSMVNRGIDAVRIPVPWYAFETSGDAPQGCVTDLDQAFTWADQYNISVLLVLASCPHARTTADGLSLIIDDLPSRRNLLLDVVARLADRYGSRTSLLGIEPIDQVLVRRNQGFPPRTTEGTKLPFLRNYYRDAYKLIRETAGDLPTVVLSDAGMPKRWRVFMSKRNYTNVWLDSHVYHHTDVLSGNGPSGVRYLAEMNRIRLGEARSGSLPVMVGEWTAAMPTFGHTITPEGQLALTRIYISSQFSSFEGCAAWFYQTWKTSTRDQFWDARIALASFEKDMLG